MIGGLLLFHGTVLISKIPRRAAKGVSEAPHASQSLWGCPKRCSLYLAQAYQTNAPGGAPSAYKTNRRRPHLRLPVHSLTGVIHSCHYFPHTPPDTFSQTLLVMAKLTCNGCQGSIQNTAFQVSAHGTYLDGASRLHLYPQCSGCESYHLCFVCRKPDGTGEIAHQTSQGQTHMFTVKKLADDEAAMRLRGGRGKSSSWGWCCTIFCCFAPFLCPSGDDQQ